MGAVLGSILLLRLVVAAVFHAVWCQLSALSSSLVTHILSMRAALPWRHRDPNAEVLYWNVRVQLLCDPCPPYHLRFMLPTSSLSCLFCVSDSNEAHGMVQVTLVWGSEEMVEDPASNVAECRLVDFTTTEFPIRRNVRGYLLPSRWAYMLHEYGACSGRFCLPAAGCTMIVEAYIDWGTVEVLPAPSERCEASAVPPHKRQVARVIPQWPRGRASLMLLNQLLQQEP